MTFDMPTTADAPPVSHAFAGPTYLFWVSFGTTDEYGEDDGWSTTVQCTCK